MRKTSIRFTLYIVLMLIVFIVIAMTYYSHYESTVTIIKSAHQSEVNLIEQSINNETTYTEIISELSEKELTMKME